MAIRLHSNRNSYPSLIRYLQLTILLLTLSSAAWYDLFLGGTVSTSPSILLLSPELSLKTFFEIFTAPFMLFYPGISLNLFFDLVVLNALVTPIYTFVLSFTGSRTFIQFIIGLIGTGLALFYFFAPLWLTPPCSLFSSLTLAIIVFWAMLHSRGQSFFLLAFPISPLLYVSIASAATIFPILTGGEWAKLVATGAMALLSYFFAIVRFHLRSNISFLSRWEEFLDKTVSRFYKF